MRQLYPDLGIECRQLTQKNFSGIVAHPRQEYSGVATFAGNSIFEKAVTGLNMPSDGKQGQVGLMRVKKAVANIKMY